MKKVFALILVVLYASASSGMVINMHYCMGQLASVKVDAMQVKKCMCGDEAGDAQDDCCKDELKVLKAGDVHKAVTTTLQFEQPTADLPVRVSLVDIGCLWSQKKEQPVAHAPPQVSTLPLTILHCTFLI